MITGERRLRHLLLVAGPSSSGKTTLIRRLREGNQAQLQAMLGVTDWHGYGVLVDDRLEPDTTLNEHGPDNLIVHYDIHRPWLRTAVGYEKDESLGLLAAADRISIVTLVVDPADLRRQLIDRTKHPRSGGWPDRARLVLRTPKQALSMLSGRRRVRHMMENRQSTRLAVYSDPGWLRQRYEDWFRYSDVLVNTSPMHVHIARRNEALHDVRQGWEQLLADYPLT